jgi:hypothetical protein
MKNLILRMTFVALLFAAGQQVVGQNIEVQLNNTRLCGSTVSFSIYDGSTPPVLLMSGVANPGSALSLCTSSAPAYAVFTEPFGCSFTVYMQTTPSVPCSGGACTCGCISTLNFEAVQVAGGSTTCPVPFGGGPLYQFNIL